mmetsp:Transcript_47996/g.89850  ORF Transcript_47996/g.89850 Transcript_47996/m.89850 type:complete len:329 (-) Transcript_47996:182-1168(-)
MRRATVAAVQSATSVVQGLHVWSPAWRGVTSSASTSTASSRSPDSSGSGTQRSAAGLSWAPGSVPSRPAPRGPEAQRGTNARTGRVRVAPEEVSYSVVIESCARRGDAHGAAGWLEEMAASAFKPNVFAFNAVIAGFARKGSAAEAAEWLDRMVAEGLEPNVVSYTAVIDGCAKVGDREGAARWFDTMLENNVTPNTLTYNAVINSCARHGDVDGALRWLERMCSSDPAGPSMQPDEISYSSAINSCANARPPAAETAELLFREMRSAGLHPTASTLTALERAVGAERSGSLCNEFGIDIKQAKRHRPPPEHRRVRPLAARASDGDGR